MTDENRKSSYMVIVRRSGRKKADIYTFRYLTLAYDRFIEKIREQTNEDDIMSVELISGRVG